MEYKFEKYSFDKYPEDEMISRAESFYELMTKRRTIREFSSEDVDIKLIELAIKTAGTAPSGANKQPWRFVVVESSEVKKEIRIAAEKEEKENYEGRMPESWLKELEQFGTDWHKEFLEIAPYLIVVFKIDYELEDEKIKKNYYVNDSVGIATGMLLTALHNMGLYTLSHTPSPMNFLRDILQRPKNEKPFLLIPVGYPAKECEVPVIKKKDLGEIMIIK